jgi:methionine synthase II (cobalamin-independent)
MLWACADAMREEYTAIIEAGLVLQFDDPAIAGNWDQINPAPSVEDYRRFTRKRIEALNYAIRDLPTERIRFHPCWGSWHGPHITDFPTADLIDRHHARGQRGRLLVRGGQRTARARVEDLAGREAARGTKDGHSLSPTAVRSIRTPTTTSGKR